MRRREDWLERVIAHVDTVRQKTFEYGALDCCLFAADCVKAMTDEDPAAPARGRYKTADEALATLLSVYEANDLPELMEALAAKYGWEEIENPRYAQRGDIILLKSDAADDPRFHGALGLCAGPLTVFIRERLRAISTIPSPGEPDLIARAWRIPLNGH
jgi:hypothetical protein